MRPGKEHASTRQTRSSVIPDDGPRASPSPAIVQADISGGSNTQPSSSNLQSDSSQPARTPLEGNSGIYQDILVECDSLVQRYRKGEIPKATAYIDIQSKLSGALGDDRSRSDAAFGSFISTIESHDSEVAAASKRGLRGEPGVVDPLQRSPSPPLSDADGQRSDDEHFTKRIKVDESVY